MAENDPKSLVFTWLAPTARCAMIGALQALLTAAVLICSASLLSDAPGLVAPFKFRWFACTIAALWPIFMGTNALYHKWRCWAADRKALAEANMRGRLDALESLGVTAAQHGLAVLDNGVGQIVDVKVTDENKLAYPADS